MAVGDLTVRVGADFAEFITGLVKAENAAAATFRRITELGAGVAIGNKLGDLVSQAVESLPRLVRGAIEAADHLQDLSAKTGIAVETLGGIGYAASQAGSSVDAATLALGKLNVSLARAAAGNYEAAGALKALGIDVIDPLTGKTIAVDKALVALANTFEKTAASPEKFRAAQVLLSRGYQELAPLLQEGGEHLQKQIDYFNKFGGITAESAQKAHEFNVALGQLKLLSEGAGQALSQELLGGLKAVVEYIRKCREEGSGLAFIFGTIRVVFETVAVLGANVAFVIEQIAKAVVLYGEAIANVAHGDLPGAKKLFDEYNEQSIKARKNLDDFEQKVLGLKPATQEEPPAPGRQNVGGIVDRREERRREEALKKTLEGQLKLIKDNADAQQDVLQYANKYLEGEYAAGVISLSNYYDDQANIRKRALANQIAEQEEIIAQEKKYQAATHLPANKIDAENKIKDANRAITKAQTKAEQENQLAKQASEAAAIALTQAFQGVNAQLLELEENFAAAAAQKFDLSNFNVRRSAAANVQNADPEIARAAAEALRASDALREAAIAQGAFQKATLLATRTLEDLSNAEERIALAQQTGALTSIDALAKLGEARRAQIPALEAQVAAEEAIANAAKAAGTPGAEDLVRKAATARLALDKLKASVDPLAESLNKMFGDDFNSAFTDFITGSKSAADAFKSFAKSVLNDLLKLETKRITESIFGGSGGIGGVLSGLFNGGKSTDLKSITAPGKSPLGESAGVPEAPTPDALAAMRALFDQSGATAAKSAETTAVTSTTTALGALTTAASSAAEALASIGAGSQAGIGSIGSIGQPGQATPGELGSFTELASESATPSAAGRVNALMSPSQAAFEAKTAAQDTFDTVIDSFNHYKRVIKDQLGKLLTPQNPEIPPLKPGTVGFDNYIKQVPPSTNVEDVRAEGPYLHRQADIRAAERYEGPAAAEARRNQQYDQFGEPINAGGMNASGHGYSPARDSQKASEDYAIAAAQSSESLDSLAATTTAQTEAAAASTAGFSDAAIAVGSAAGALGKFSGVTNLAAQALQLLQSATGKSGSGASGLFSTIFGSGGGDAAAAETIAAAAGPFAEGGTIPPGKWGLVGERGPEIAYGGGSGVTIVPAPATKIAQAKFALSAPLAHAPLATFFTNEKRGAEAGQPGSTAAIKLAQPLLPSTFNPGSFGGRAGDVAGSFGGRADVRTRADAGSFGGVADVASSFGGRTDVAASLGVSLAAPEARVAGIFRALTAHAETTAPADKIKKPRFAGFFADGGYIPPQTWAITGERGPEKVFGGKTGVTVQPARTVADASAPGNVHINVINQGEPVTAQETGRRQTSDGMVIDVVLRAVAKDIRSGGVVHQAASQQYGLNRAAGAPTRS